MDEPDTQPTSRELKHERADIQAEIDEWRQWWIELREYGVPHFAEMGDRLARIRDFLSEHFQHVESSEDFATIEACQDSESQSAQQLISEHGDLIEELDQISRQLKTCGCDELCWGEARTMFEAFLTRLEQHETKENKLIECSREDESLSASQASEDESAER